MTERIHVTMHEAKTQLSQLAERAWHGDTGRQALSGLMPNADTPLAHKPGRVKGEIQMSADFAKAPEDIIDDLEAAVR